MRTLPLTLVFAASLATAATLTAQDIPAPPSARPGAQVTANARWVYVVFDGRLHQFDAETLQWKRSVEIPASPAVVPGDEGGLSEEVVIAEAEPEPRPEAPSRESIRRAIDAGLAWLLEQQEDDGRWSSANFWVDDPAIRNAMGRTTPARAAQDIAGAGSPVHDVGATAIAVLALLGDGSTLRDGPNQTAIKNGIAWLRSQMDPDTGLIGAKAAHDYIYDHAIATLALCEAGGLSDSKIVLRDAQRAVEYLGYHRNPYNVWRYEPKSGDNDTSVTGWCTMALFAAKSFGLTLNESAFQLAQAWIDEMTDPVTGRVGYSERGGWSSRRPGDHADRFPRDRNETMTAVGIAVRLFAAAALGTEKNKERAITASAKSAGLLAEKLPTWNPAAGNVDYVAWWFGSQAMFQLGGEHWKDWSAATFTALLEGQRDGDGFGGSWDPAGPWGPDGGRIMSTALATMTLQSGYRYARLIRDR